MSATALLAGGLWGVDQLSATNPTAATSSVDASGSNAQRNTTTYDDGGSEYDDSSSSGGGTSFTPSVSHADTSSHAS